jgi:uncharacterized protein YrzB (UPF0473 family)
MQSGTKYNDRQLSEWRNNMSENESEERDNIVILTDENGNDAEFEWLDTIEMKDNQYIVVLPIEDEASEEVVILRLEAEGEEENFIPVEDEKELNDVFESFKERNKENFDFVD